MIGKWLAKAALFLAGRTADPETARAYLQLAALHQERLTALRAAEWKLNAACWLATGGFGARLLVTHPGAWMSAAACAWFAAVLTFHWTALRRSDRAQRREQASIDEFRARALRALKAPDREPRGGERSGTMSVLWIDVFLALALAAALVFAPARERNDWRMPEFEETVSYVEEIGSLRLDPADEFAGQ